MFKSRVALAATLSSNYGIYNGFELLEHEPIPGKEEYLNSEKYEIKVRDWNKPGNIKDYIGQLNRLRREQPGAAADQPTCVSLQVDDDDVIGFVKESVDGDNAVAVAIALDGTGRAQFWFHFGDIEIGPPTASAAGARDRESGHRRAAHARMGRRAADDRSGATIPRSCSAAMT